MLDKSQEQHEAWATFELTDRELAAFGDLSRSRTISLQGEGEQRVDIALQVRARLPDLGEVLVEAIDYEDWRPRGDLDDPSRPGNRLKVRAWVKQSGDEEVASDRRVKLTFELAGVSAQKGVCNNAPIAALGKADLRPDLRLLEGDNPGLRVEHEAKATTRERVGEATLTIAAFDFGGWGRLRITAEDSKGRQVPVTLKGREGKQGAALPIPQDDDENRVADGWQRQRGVFGVPGDVDDDGAPRASGFDGDGLTLYEEYRGFMVKGAFVDTDPKRKDLFVCDQSGRAAAGLALFEAASGLAVHTTTCWELGEDRVINRYPSVGPHRVDQHGLRIEGGAGSASAEGVAGPPRFTPRILLPAPPAGQGRDRAEYDSDVAHELGHAVGARHHGHGKLIAVVYRWVPVGAAWSLEAAEIDANPDVDPDRYREKAGRPRVRIQLRRESDGTTLAKGDPLPPGFAWHHGLRGWIGFEVEAHGETSGDDACLMRNGEKGVYLREGGPPTERWIPDGADWRPRTGLCQSAAGTGVNAPGRRPHPRYGDATYGDCMGRLVVNDLAPAYPAD